MENEILTLGQYSTGKSVDFSQHINAINKIRKELNNNALIAITGRTGSGKSGLAQVLKDNIDNAFLIDAGALCSYAHRSLDISSFITNKDIIYIIDDVSYVTKDSLTTIVHHIKQGGTLILFMQDERDLTVEWNVTYLCM